jgi:hypothetical protein
LNELVAVTKVKRGARISFQIIGHFRNREDNKLMRREDFGRRSVTQ